MTFNVANYAKRSPAVSLQLQYVTFGDSIVSFSLIAIAQSSLASRFSNRA